MIIFIVFRHEKKHDISVSPYLPTLPVFPGVSKFLMKSPGLLVRAPNLPGTTYMYLGSFYISYLLIEFVGNVLFLH